MADSKHKRPADREIENTDPNYDQSHRPDKGGNPGGKHKRPSDKTASDKGEKAQGADHEENKLNKEYRYEEALPEEAQFKLSDELGSLLESEGMSEDFKEQAVTIFEAAVNHAANDYIEDLKEQFNERIEEIYGELQEDMESKVNKYLDYVVNEWKEENRLAIESGVRLENAESFMDGLKNLLEQHYVSVPEEKEDVYEQAVADKKEAERELNEQVEKVADLHEQVNDLRKQIVLEGYTRKLTDVQADKLRGLAEGVDFEDEDSFKKKLDTLAENYITDGGDDSPAGNTDGDQLAEDFTGDETAEVEDEKGSEVQDAMTHLNQLISQARW